MELYLPHEYIKVILGVNLSLIMFDVRHPKTIRQRTMQKSLEKDDLLVTIPILFCNTTKSLRIAWTLHRLISSIEGGGVAVDMCD